jgi:hypothetical protein
MCMSFFISLLTVYCNKYLSSFFVKETKHFVNKHLLIMQKNINPNTRAIRKLTSGELLTTQAVRKKNYYMQKILHT